MSNARIVGVALAAACATVALALVGQPIAFAGTCGTSNSTFDLGITNTCNTGPSTYLTGNGPNGLFVELTGFAANTRPVIGYASGNGPTAGSVGVAGSTNSTGGFSAGMFGSINADAPAADSAGVKGFAYSSTANGSGVWGSHPSSTGTGPGVLGDTNATNDFATGILGIIQQTAPGVGSAGVRGMNNGKAALGVGVWGSHAGSGYGVYGSTPLGTGVVGLHEDRNGTNPGVQGETNSGANGAIGVLGRISRTAPGAGSAAVRGINNGTGAAGVGVWGSHAGSGWGVYGISPAGNGVVGESTTGFAGFFNGNV